jgi:hypothetical protein
MTFVVRPAVSHDIPWMLEELVAFDQFFGAGRPLMPSVEFARERLSWMIENRSTFLFLVIVNRELDVEKQLGFLLSIFQQHFFNPDILQCQSLLWWMMRDARGTPATPMLLDEWVRQARVKANWIVLTVQEKTPINTRSLERRNFKLIDQKWLLEVIDHDYLPGVPL